MVTRMIRRKHEDDGKAYKPPEPYGRDMPTSPLCMIEHNDCRVPMGCKNNKPLNVERSALWGLLRGRYLLLVRVRNMTKQIAPSPLPTCSHSKSMQHHHPLRPFKLFSRLNSRALISAFPTSGSATRPNDHKPQASLPSTESLDAAVLRNRGTASRCNRAITKALSAHGLLLVANITSTHTKQRPDPT